jgi:hypothetical protein
MLVRQVGQIAFFLGMTLLVLGWVRLLRQARAGAPWLSNRVIAAVAVLWSAPLVLSPPLGSRDAYSYLAQGYLAANGLNPYMTTPDRGSAALLAPVSSSWTDATSPYGPLFSLLTAGVTSATGEDYAVGLVVLRLLVVASYVAVAWLLVSLLGTGSHAARLGLILVVLNPLLLVHGLSGVHNEMLLLPLLASAALAARGRRFVLAGLLMGAAIGVKVTAAAVLPFLLLLPVWPGWRRYASRLAVATAAGAALLATIGGLGGFGVSWVLAPVDSASRGSRLSLSTTLADVTEAWFPVAVPARPIITLGALALAAVAVLWLLVHRRREPLFSAGLAAIAVAASGPLLHPWYFLPPLLYLSVRSLSLPTNRAIIGGTCGLSLLVRPEGGEIFKGAGPLAVACVLLGYAVLAADAWRQARRSQRLASTCDPAEVALVARGA